MALDTLTPLGALIHDRLAEISKKSGKKYREKDLAVWTGMDPSQLHRILHYTTTGTIQRRPDEHTVMRMILALRCDAEDAYALLAVANYTIATDGYAYKAIYRDLIRNGNNWDVNTINDKLYEANPQQYGITIKYPRN